MHIASCVWQEKAAASAMVSGGGEWAARRVSVVALLASAGGALNCAVSFVVFSFLDVLDMVLCVVYRLVDYAVEAEWKACYCTAAAAASASGAETTAAARIVASRGPKVVRLSASSAKLQLEDVSDTLYVRPSLLADATKKAGPAAPTLTVSPAIAEMIRGKIDRAPRPRAPPCWSDCDCKVCHAWTRSASHLYVHVQAPPPATSASVEDVVFIHGFISSSVFWTETIFPAFSASARGKYRMFAVDLLGFGLNLRTVRVGANRFPIHEAAQGNDGSQVAPLRFFQWHRGTVGHRGGPSRNEPVVCHRGSPWQQSKQRACGLRPGQ